MQFVIKLLASNNFNSLNALDRTTSIGQFKERCPREFNN